MAARAHRVGAGACAITDHGNVSGVPQFLKAMKNACKHCGHQPNQHADSGKGPCNLRGVSCPGYEPGPLKPILGSEFYLCKQDAAVREKENRGLSHLVVLAKNREGWRNLVQASSDANRPEHYYYKPRLDLDRLAAHGKGQWVAFSGHPGSDLADCCFADPKASYRARTEEEARALLKPPKELRRDLVGLANRYQDLFGRGNFFLEVQLVDAVNLPAAGVVAKAMRWLSAETGIPRLATPDAHYPATEDAADQRILLCAALDTTLNEAERRLAAGDDVMLGGFFRSRRYHIPDQQEMAALHDPEELANTLAVAEMCETYDVFHKPRLPQFECPNGARPEEYLRALCRDGWRRKVQPVLDLMHFRGGDYDASRAAYADRIRTELDVLTGAGLAPYFLIVWDICRHAQAELGCPKSKGRGSAAGCLVSHLLDITDCDPVRYGLIFERFYNAGRNDPATGRVSMPDIDMDFPVTKRDLVVDYARAKYGDDRVCQMATFGRLQGRAALTEVLRAHEWGSFDDRKRVTQFVPDEAAIADELQEMLEATGESSILRWALDHNRDELSPYCVEEDDGSLSGPLAQYFEQAMRIEGARKSQGKHAAGVIISPVPLADECPMLYDKSTGRMVAGFEMGALEDLGFLKFDFLGTADLDKVAGVCRTRATGKVGMA